jgi:hypothetical protein
VLSACSAALKVLFGHGPSRILTRVLYVAGGTLVVIGLLLVWAGPYYGRLSFWCAAAATMLVANRLLRIGQLHESQLGLARVHDERPPVLYLRRFSFDRAELPVVQDNQIDDYPSASVESHNF